MSAVFADAGFGGFLIICNTLLLLAEKLTPPIAPMDYTSVGTNFAKSVINLQKRWALAESISVERTKQNQKKLKEVKGNQCFCSLL